MKIISILFSLLVFGCSEKSEPKSGISQHPFGTIINTEKSSEPRVGITRHPLGAVINEVPVQRAKCFPSIPNVAPEDMPAELEIDCLTHKPVNQTLFNKLRIRLNQEEMYARQQAAAESNDDRMLGIQQRQDDCKYRYPGVFSPQNPLGGMCADSPEQISTYNRNQITGQEARNEREIQAINNDAVSRCRRLCIGSSNYASCAAGCN